MPRLTAVPPRAPSTHCHPALGLRPPHRVCSPPATSHRPAMLTASARRAPLLSASCSLLSRGPARDGQSNIRADRAAARFAKPAPKSKNAGNNGQSNAPDARLRPYPARATIPLVRGVAQPGRAPDWGSGGRWFESSRPDQLPPPTVTVRNRDEHPVVLARCHSADAHLIE